MSMQFFQGKGNKAQYDFEGIDKYFSQYSYVCGYTATKCDIDLFKDLINIDLQRYNHIKRWWYHMQSFCSSEISLLPESQAPDILKKVKTNTESIDNQVCK